MKGGLPVFIIAVYIHTLVLYKQTSQAYISTKSGEC